MHNLGQKDKRKSKENQKTSFYIFHYIFRTDMIDIFGGIGSVTSGITGFFGNSFKSPLWTAIIISVLIMLILLIFYPTKKGIGPAKHIKVMIYILIATIGVMYMHDSTIKGVWDDEHKNKAVEETLGGLRQHINGGTSLAAVLGGVGSGSIIAPTPPAPAPTQINGGITPVSFSNVQLKLPGS